MSNRGISRRDFFRLGAGLVAAAGAARLVPVPGTNRLAAAPIAEAAVEKEVQTSGRQVVHLVATDGWISMPKNSAVPAPGSGYNYYPDPAARPGQGMYVFGFDDVTDLWDPNDMSPVWAHPGHVINSAPIIGINELDDVTISLTNLGFSQRPDLFDSHTIHFHGFRNALPLYDGVPEISIAVPIGRTFNYYYKPHGPGTYMYHCHHEEVEHVQMGMQGSIYIRAIQNQGDRRNGIPVARLNDPNSSGPMGYCYNDEVPPSDPRSTAYDREYAFHLSDLWAEAHWNDAHEQATDWSEYRANFFTMNGRCYPDTLQPNFEADTFLEDAQHQYPPGSDAERLQYQPHTSLVRCCTGERVLLRIENLGYELPNMRLAGIPLRVVGRDAQMMRGRDNSDLSYYSESLPVPAGEAFDGIFVAPTSGSTTYDAAVHAYYDTYIFYNRAVGHDTNPGVPGLGGQATEVRVYPAGALAPQTAANDLA
jgi:FtsP/CotA-like multicopper oxidase with cupredoxin domain